MRNLTQDLTAILNGGPDSFWSFVPLKGRWVGAVKRDLRENNGNKSGTAAHNASAAIRQIIWRLADWGQPPCEVMTLLTLEGGLGWKCVSLAPCCVPQRALELCCGTCRLKGDPAAVPAVWSLPEGLFVCGVRPFVPPTHTNKQMSGHWVFLVGSCKPPSVQRLPIHMERLH